MFDHCFSRNELQNRANWIFSVRHAIPEDTNRLVKLLWIGVIDVRISDFWPVVDAPETLLGNSNIAANTPQTMQRLTPVKTALCFNAEMASRDTNAIR